MSINVNEELSTLTENIKKVTLLLGELEKTIDAPDGAGSQDDFKPIVSVPVIPQEVLNITPTTRPDTNPQSGLEAADVAVQVPASRGWVSSAVYKCIIL
jgi:hypothetical protein